MKPVLSKFKFYLSLLAVVGCLVLPFVNTFLLRIYGVDASDNSFETFQFFRNQLVPIRTFILNVVLVICLVVLCWNMIDYSKSRRIRLFDLVISVFVLLAVSGIVLIQTVMPSRLF